VDPVLVLNDPEARVDPGSETRVSVSVRNVGDLVEQYQFEVLGESARWAQVIPRQVSVLPHGQEEKTVEVVFRPPPAPAAPAGEIPFGVRCVSLERRDRCAVVEGDVAVGAVHNLAARLDPVTPRGRWTGRYRAHFDNTGSVPVTLRLEAGDTKQLLRFALAPRELTVESGQSGRAYLSVRPRQPMTRGKPVEHPFVFTYRAAVEGGSGELPGTFEQRPIISKAVFALAALVVGLAVGGGALLLRANGGGQQKAALVTDGPPPPTELISVQPLTGNSVQIVWARSPYATGFVVQQVANGTVGAAKEVQEPDQTTIAWPGLKPGKTCFQVVTVGKSGRSAPSGQKCLTLAVPPPPTSAPVTSTAPPTTAPTSVPPSGGGGGGGGGDGGPKVLIGYYVIYANIAQDDAGSQGDADKIAERLQIAGSQAFVVNSLDYEQLRDQPDGKSGFWVVVQDGFDNYPAAAAECNRRRPSVVAQCLVNRPG
jgi:hypothetical protein